MCYTHNVDYVAKLQGYCMVHNYVLIANSESIINAILFLELLRGGQRFATSGKQISLLSHLATSSVNYCQQISTLRLPIYNLQNKTSPTTATQSSIKST